MSSRMHTVGRRKEVGKTRKRQICNTTHGIAMLDGQRSSSYSFDAAVEATPDSKEPMIHRRIPCHHNLTRSPPLGCTHRPGGTHAGKPNRKRVPVRVRWWVAIQGIRILRTPHRRDPRGPKGVNMGGVGISVHHMPCTLLHRRARLLTRFLGGVGLLCVGVKESNVFDRKSSATTRGN